MSSLRLLGAALALLLASPLAAAAQAEGRFEIEGPMAFDGDVVLRSPRVDLLWVSDEAPVLALTADALRVERWGVNHTFQHTPVATGVRVSQGRIDQQADHAQATAVARTGADEQFLVARAAGAAELAADALTLRPIEGAHLFEGFEANRCHPEHCARTFGSYEASAPATTAALSGELTLLLRGPTLVVTSEGKETAYESGLTTRTTGTLTIYEDAWIRVVATNARLDVQAAEPARWYAHEPRIEADRVAAADGTGALSVGAFTYRADNEAFDAAGRLEVLADALPARRYFPSGVEYADAFGARIQGRVDAVSLASTPVFADSAEERAGLLAAAAVALTALAYYWPHVSFHATSAAIPFYTRLKRPDILGNNVRNAIYDIIRASPGISARAVQRQSELSWGTVVYHLRQLERHHLVVSRALGRTRNYYENHGKYKGMELQLACLQQPRSLTLARLVLQTPGLTQEALAQASGLPQPTTSYYVRKLKQAGLVEEQREGRYAKYVPGAELARYVDLAEAPPRPGPDAVLSA